MSIVDRSVSAAGGAASDTKSTIFEYGDRYFSTTRLYDAPRELVYRALTDPELIPKWWGPRYLTTVVVEADVRPGGRWRFVQRDPDGNEFAFEGTYLELVPPERIVQTFSYVAEMPVSSTETATLTDMGGKTLYHAVARFGTQEEMDNMVGSGMEEGATETMDRLDEVLTMLKQGDDSADRRLSVSRTIHAPRERVWRAFTDPAHLPHWWGPRGFSITTQEMDLREGGVWRFVMHGADGTDYPNVIRYTRLDKPSRIEGIHGAHSENDPDAFRMTVTLDERGDDTDVTLSLLFADAAQRDTAVREIGAIEGGRETLARLSERVELIRLDDEPRENQFVFTRTVNAPRSLVWKAYTDADALAAWWAPAGQTNKVLQLDLRPDGIYHYAQTSSIGKPIYGRFVYREVTPPERLVFVSSFSDEDGGIGDNPFGFAFPAEILNVVTLSEKDGRTTIEIRGAPIHATEEEVSAYRNLFSSLNAGYAGTLDNLERWLAAQ